MEHISIDRSKQQPRNWHRAPCLASHCERAAEVNGGGLCRAHQEAYVAIVTEEIGARVAKVRVDRSGYVHIQLSRGGIWQAAHRFVMCRELGRDLYPGENVHHLNGNRGDNRPENLELWVVSQPAGQRPDDLVRYARELLARYGDDNERALYEPPALPATA